MTRDQARHIYKKVETGEIINVDTVKHEIDQEKQLSQIDDDSGEVNPYRELMGNNAEKIEVQKTQMEQWSILSNLLNYVQHSKFNTMGHSLNIKPVYRYKVRPDEEREFREVDFGMNSQNLQDEYLDIYEGIHSDIVSSSRFDENSDISTTYLGNIGWEESQNKLKSRGVIPYIRKWLHLGQAIGWYKMSITTRHRC